MKILGIETSCDETAAGVVDGHRLLSSTVRTQFDLHARYGGVVPELASRRHVEVVVDVVDAALSQAGLTLDDLDGLAVTQGPGLIGALLVGLNFAKGVSLVTGLPLVGVNHLLAHISAGFLLGEPASFPLAALVVSGGHTNLYYLEEPLEMTLLGRTRDDAAGEAYDKVAKLLGLGYPGGRVIDDLAQQGDPKRFPLPRPMLGEGLDFSFSGLKTAVMQTIRDSFKDRPMEQSDLADLCASFQAAVVDVLAIKTTAMLRQVRVNGLILCGGVACNRELRQRMADVAAKAGLPLILPPPSLCSDNGAMVARAGYDYLKAGQTIDLDADAWAR